MPDLVVSHDVLKKLAQRSSFPVPESGLVFFGFRGLLPLDLSGTDFAPAHKVRQVNFDHQHMRCTLGQWLPADGEVALFPGSTVPDRGGVEKARQNGGIGANMLMPGRYAYDRGVHKPGKPTGHRAFRQGMFFPVWRTSDDLDYDLADRLDIGGISPENYPWDNLHCAYADNVDLPKYSSSGCQVVSGRPTMEANGNAPESGPWKKFIANAYGPAAGGQTRFVYLLFSGTEVGRISLAPDGPLDRSVRFGSQGEWVTRVQTALKDKGFPFLEADEDFGRDTLEALMGFQAAQFGRDQADGVVGPNTANALGIDWPKVSFTGSVAPMGGGGTAPTPPPSGGAVPPDWQKAAVKITPGFETTGDPYEAAEGNFDKMGISCGALQWNIGQNSLQPMVRAVGEAVVRAKMPTRGGDLWRACNADTATGLGIVIGWQNGTKLPAATKAELKALMGSAEMRAEQDRKIDVVARKSLDNAGSWARAAGRAKASKREFCWFFEIITQNGGLEQVTQPRVAEFLSANGQAGSVKIICDFLAAQTGSSGHVKDANKNGALWRGLSDARSVELLVMSYLRSQTANPEWRHVVLNRKGTVAVGEGWVNGSKYDFKALLTG